MKLARKLTLALMGSIVTVLAVQSYVVVQREVAYSEKSLRQDAHTQGRVLGLVLDELWHREGQVRALQFVDEINEEEASGHIRWVWLNAREDDPYAPRAPRAVLGPVALGQEVTYHEPHANLIRTYIPAAIESGRPGAIEISQSTARQREFVQATFRNHIVTTVVMAALCGAMVMLLGGWFVGRPIRSLVEKARRVGAGDLSGPLVLRQKDEIRVLADEMNAMCVRLDHTHGALAAATEAKFAALEQLRHADRLSTVGKLASGIAHELGTPLNVVNGRARMIKDGETPRAEIDECADIIVEQTQRMTAIIRQLLDFARRRGAHKSPQDLVQLARQTASLLTPLADKRRASIRVTADGAADLSASVDTGQLQQALTNLIVNAIQAMPKGGTITVGVARTHARPPAGHSAPEGEYICLSVADEGEGMSPETMAHMFEPFFTTKAAGEGTGLGLSVTYGIVSEHGGWIDVASELGRGSRFAIHLPPGES